MDSNFWFYTLSAIPQTLGAIIALTAIFVIFKLDHIERRTKTEYDEIKKWVLVLLPETEIHEITKLDYSAMLQKLKEGIGKLDPKEHNLGFEGYDRLRDLYQDVITSYKRSFNATEERIYDYLAEKERILTSLLEVRRGALHRLKISLASAALPIGGSLILLPFYPEVYLHAFWIVVILVVLAIFALLYTTYSVWEIAGPELR